MKSNDSFSKTDESLFETTVDLPDTSELKSRIIQLTATMPQHDEHADLRQNGSLLSKLFEPKFVVPFAVAASIALIAILWVPGASQQLTSSDVALSEATPSIEAEVFNVKAEAFNTTAEAPNATAEAFNVKAEALNTTAEALNTTTAEAPFTVYDDLEFQEAMIFFDEQLFVQQ